MFVISQKAWSREAGLTVLGAVLSLVGSRQVVADETPHIPQLAPVISSAPLAREIDEIAAPVLVLQGAALDWQRQPTLGGTLNGEPGIHQDNFGAGASRPVIRGQGAPRVMVLSEGSRLLDASEVSPDHALGLETGFARQIEVLRGPSTLLYGGGAIGGVVNVLDDKIPTALPERGLEADLGLAADSGARRREATVGLTAGVGQMALRVEALKDRSDDYRVPKQASRHQPDTWAKRQGGTVGASWVHDRGYAGLAWTELRRQYGVPGHSHEYADCHPHGAHLHCGGHGHAHGAVSHLLEEGDHADNAHDEHEHDHLHAGSPWIDQTSRRLDWRADYRDPLPGLSRIRVRGGWTDYRHDEIEGEVVGSRFSHRGHDGRIELDHQPIAGWRGTLGASWLQGHFDVTGDEAFMPPTLTRSQGVFLLETYAVGDWQFELGARQEWQQVTPDSQQSSWRGQATSWSAGTLWQMSDSYQAGLTLTYAQRMPNAQELYATGKHLATNTFELGDAHLGKERSRGMELSLRKTEGDTRFEVSAYQQRFRDYIYAATLDQFEDFRLIQYRQQDAVFTGVEGKVEQRLSAVWRVDLSGDWVRARFNDGANLPRIPAARIGAGVTANWQGWQTRLDVSRVFAQKQTASYESATAGYTLVNVGVSYRWQAGGLGYEASLHANNLLDQLAYNHASFLANSVPLPGRNVVLGLRVRY